MRRLRREILDPRLRGDDERAGDRFNSYDNLENRSTRNATCLRNPVILRAGEFEWIFRPEGARMQP